eukprot:m.356458 g.356458  ORF g.356458 m.356458 type:complete len:56 (-) comp17546_c0_seq1:148-315(-)
MICHGVESEDTFDHSKRALRISCGAEGEECNDMQMGVAHTGTSMMFKQYEHFRTT